MRISGFLLHILQKIPFPILLGLCLLAGSAFAASPAETLANLAPDGGLLVTKSGKIVYSRNEDKALIPASTLKIGTALAAIRILGPDYRFTTEFYLSADKDLFIRGLADPLLTSEEGERIVAALRRLGLQAIRHILTDEGACRLAGPTDGAGASLNPYDAQNGCLTVNFNTINLLVGTDGSISSGEPQTPTLPLMNELGRGLPSGSHRINITADGNNSQRYTGELFAAILHKQGLTVNGNIGTAATPRGLAPFYIHRSERPLGEVLTGLLRYSNNFIANQLLLACGAKRFGWPATWEKGRTALSDFYRHELGLSAAQIKIVEGSGLSRQNRVSPMAMLAILEAFKPHAQLLTEQNGRLLKSGTMTGVSAYAGYFPGEKGLDSFVLILNQPGNRRDQVLELLAAIHGSR